MQSAASTAAPGDGALPGAGASSGAGAKKAPSSSMPSAAVRRIKSTCIAKNLLRKRERPRWPGRQPAAGASNPCGAIIIIL